MVKMIIIGWHIKKEISVRNNQSMVSTVIYLFLSRCLKKIAQWKLKLGRKSETASFSHDYEESAPVYKLN